jgi:hypothetical protein
MLMPVMLTEIALSLLRTAVSGPLEVPTAWVVVDEVQRQPDLFPILRVLADRNPGQPAS